MIKPTGHNQHWFLNSVTGWVKCPRTDLTRLGVGSDGLSLDALPGSASEFQPPVGDDLCCPGAVAVDQCGRVLILDVVCGRIVRIENSFIHQLTEFGGAGSGRRQFNAPRGLAVRPDALLVSDSGNHRVQVFSPAPYALIQVWGRSDGTAGDGKLEFNRPWGISVDACGNTFVADRGNRRIQKIAKGGEWIATLGDGLLTDPTTLAAGPKGLVAVVDGPFSPSGGRVVIFDSSSPGAVQVIAGLNVAPDADDPYLQTVTILSELFASTPTQPMPVTVRPLKACAVAFDDQGRLFIAANTGVVHRFDPDAAKPGQYRFIGAGVSGLSASINMAWLSGVGLVAIVPDPISGLRRLWKIPTNTSFVAEGTMLSAVLDSNIDDCVWDRITLSAMLPFGTSMQVEYFTSTDGSEKSLLESKSSGSYTFVSVEKDPDSTPTPPAPVQQDWTCLVNTDVGRYLQLRLTFRSNTQATPALNSASIYFPRESYLQYLPAVFQEDPRGRDFMDRFLANFKETVDGFDARIDGITALLDPLSVPEEFFLWLAAWIDFKIDPTWGSASKRKMLKNAVKTSRNKGTLAGIKQAITDSLQATTDPSLTEQENHTQQNTAISIIEHFKLRKWPILRATAVAGNVGDGQSRLWSHDFYQRLQVGKYARVGALALTDRPIPAGEAPAWGAHEFTVFFSAHPLRIDALKQKIQTIVEREKPGHTKANIVAVLPRFRIGVQSTLGIDTRVGVCTPLVLGTISRLGYDAILAPSQALRDMHRLGTSPRPSVGVNTRLF